MKCTLWVPSVAIALAGCYSLPAPHYYALDAVHPVSAASHSTFPFLIRVRHVGLPYEIDHLGLTHHLGPTELAISDTDRWTAPLNVLIQGTLTRDLGERLGYEHVVATDALALAQHPDSDQRGTPSSTQTVLDVDFLSLSADDRCGITAQVNWTLSVASGEAHVGAAHLAAPAGSCPAGLPAALSTALGDLADQIVLQLTAS